MSDKSYQHTIRILQHTLQKQGELIAQIRRIIEGAEIKIAETYGVVITDGYLDIFEDIKEAMEAYDDGC